MTFRRYSMLSGWGAGAAFAVLIVMWPNMALGMIRAKSAVPRLMEAYQTDSPAIVIPDSARWALGMIGGPSPAPVKEFPQAIGSWSLSCLDD